jgi:hypothetical protein
LKYHHEWNFTPHPQAGNTTGCGPNGVVFPYFLARKYHPGGILAITQECVGEVRSFADVVRGTTNGSSYVTDTDARALSNKCG